MCMLRFHQMICFMNLISNRFRLINEIIREIHQNEWKFFVSEIVFTISKKKNCVKAVNEWRSIMLTKNLEQIMEASRLLNESTIVFCKIFGWSLLLGLFNEFQNALTDIQYTIYVIIIGQLEIDVIPWVIWFFLNFYHISGILTACQKLKIEVNINTNIRCKCQRS